MVGLTLNHSITGPSAMVLLTILVVGVVACQQGRAPGDLFGELRAALPEEISGWRASDDGIVYDTDSIFSYIDGHAEVYLAYGMRRCLARRYTGPAGEPDLVVDVFEMASPEDAFGVYTHDQDGEPVEVGSDGLMRHGWLSFWKGSVFVSVYAEGDSESARAAALGLARVLDAAITEPGARPALVDALPASGLEPRSVRFLRSHQILNGFLYLSDHNVLDLSPETSAVLAHYRRENAAGYLLIVDYPEPGRREAASRRFAAEFLGGDDSKPRRTVDGGWYALGGGGSRLVAVLAADTGELARSLRSELQHAEAP